MQRRRLNGILLLACSVVLLHSRAYGATITGTVKGPDGTPFRGAFVDARNARTRITVMVLSDSNGRYRVENLPAGDYHVQARSTGYRSDPRSGILLTENQTANYDWSLQKQPLRWTDVTVSQWFKVLPEEKGKAQFIRFCGLSCHGGFQNMVGLSRDENAWRRAVSEMRTRIAGGILEHMTDDDAEVLSNYLGKTFGSGPGALPKSPSDLPGFVPSPQNFSDEALKIVYVMYEIPDGRVVWSANPDKEGNLWLPYFGAINGIGKLNPKTGELREYMFPDQRRRTAVHSVFMAPDGIVWVAAEQNYGVSKFDPKTEKFTDYKTSGEGEVNTVRVDPSGIVWVSGVPRSLRFDPRTEKFTELTEIPNTYAVNLDRAGNPWFDATGGAGEIYRVDYKTGKVNKWNPPPATGSRRRIQVDSAGTVWVALYTEGKIVRLDQETGAFKTYDLPGEQPTPYPVGIDAGQNIWYASGIMDTVDRMDPNTGKVTEFPVPAFSNGMRELNNDSQGRMWFASPGNNTVGYFYLAK
ncbi:MAG TPA: carboxypeptidase regulatory-like domain-containing protein [Bryobacteraceae bacterium]|nr:carboxypeptidase regulatory-like domain-containing protein [Bryobacteraceae bacterium]